MHVLGGETSSVFSYKAEFLPDWHSRALWSSPWQWAYSYSTPSRRGSIRVLQTGPAGTWSRKKKPCRQTHGRWCYRLSVPFSWSTVFPVGHGRWWYPVLCTLRQPCSAGWGKQPATVCPVGMALHLWDNIWVWEIYLGYIYHVISKGPELLTCGSCTKIKKHTSDTKHLVTE